MEINELVKLITKTDTRVWAGSIEIPEAQGEKTVEHTLQADYGPSESGVPRLSIGYQYENVISSATYFLVPESKYYGDVRSSVTKLVKYLIKSARDTHDPKVNRHYEKARQDYIDNMDGFNK